MTLKGHEYRKKLTQRKLLGNTWRVFFLMSNVIALFMLVVLFGTIVNQAFGLVAIEYTVKPEEISDIPLDQLSEGDLVNLLVEYVPNRLRVIIRDRLSDVTGPEFTTTPLAQLLPDGVYPEELSGSTINELSPEQHASLLRDNLSHQQLVSLVMEEIAKPTIVANWTLADSLLRRDEIEIEAREQHPDATISFYAWASVDFVSRSVSSSATTAGLKTALLGSLWIIGITIIVAFPLGVFTAIYLEEYASRKNWLSRLNQINIRNLAGVPSIIYGILGLAVFVRVMEPVTSGTLFGVTDTNGRTILSAGLTMALLILPVIIINAQEAIRAVPQSIREASYALGTTRWQTVLFSVLPAAMPGILTGVILAISRAVGETAPLIVVGASTFIGIDPWGPFSKFTVIPIQIFQWTSRPEAEFKALAAAASLVLLALVLTLNISVIVFRQRIRRRLQF